MRHEQTGVQEAHVNEQCMRAITTKEAAAKRGNGQSLIVASGTCLASLLEGRSWPLVATDEWRKTRMRSHAKVVGCYRACLQKRRLGAVDKYVQHAWHPKSEV
eukprot:131818-Pelagomonas_calceolata.AAC.5